MNQGQNKDNVQYGWWIAVVLFLAALSFIFDLWGDRKIIREQTPAEYKYYSTDPVRQDAALGKAETRRAGFEFNCDACHKSLEPPAIPRKLIGAHQEIVMRHEEAMTCYTCHSREDREKLNDIYGNEVTFEQSQELCHRCHGPRYRDWKLGIHGRPMGYWDKTKGKSENITCVYCHNPHAPKFLPMKPSPPPVRDNYRIGNKENIHE